MGRTRDRLEGNRERIEQSDQLDERDIDLLLEFDRQLALRNHSDARHLKLIRHCRVLGGHVDAPHGPGDHPDAALADALDDRDAAENLVHWINQTYDNEETNRDYRVALRTFGKFVTDGDEVPETLDWIPSTTSRSYNPTPDPAEMVSWDEAQTLIEHTFTTRDKALIAIAWDAGPRGGELHDLRIGDVSDHDHGLQIHVDGKQGQRTVPLFVASSHLTAWLSDHPRSDDDTAPLWCKLADGADKISYQRLGAIFREAADRCGFDKPPTVTNFRKSSASHLASQGVTQAVLEDHHGWCRGSDVAGRYIAVFSDASDREIAAAHGLDIDTEDDGQVTASVDCPRCGDPTPSNKPFCMHCHAAIDPEANAVLDDLTEEIKDRLVAAESTERRQKLVDLQTGVEDNAGRMTKSELHELASSIDSSF